MENIGYAEQKQILIIKKNGYATALMKAAVEFHGVVYISTADEMQHKDNNDNTARYLVDKGPKLVKRCIKEGILQDEWCINPFYGNDHFNDY